MALLFQSNMAEIGMTVNVVKTPWLSVVENMAAQETSPHIATIYVSADLPEAGLMLKERYHSSTAGTWQQNRVAAGSRARCRDRRCPGDR